MTAEELFKSIESLVADFKKESENKSVNDAMIELVSGLMIFCSEKGLEFEDICDAADKKFDDLEAELHGDDEEEDLEDDEEDSESEEEDEDEEEEPEEDEEEIDEDPDNEDDDFDDDDDEEDEADEDRVSGEIKGGIDF